MSVRPLFVLYKVFSSFIAFAVTKDVKLIKQLIQLYNISNHCTQILVGSLRKMVQTTNLQELAQPIQCDQEPPSRISVIVYLTDGQSRLLSVKLRDIRVAECRSTLDFSCVKGRKTLTFWSRNQSEAPNAAASQQLRLVAYMLVIVPGILYAPSLKTTVSVRHASQRLSHPQGPTHADKFTCGSRL